MGKGQPFSAISRAFENFIFYSFPTGQTSKKCICRFFAAVNNAKTYFISGKHFCSSYNFILRVNATEEK